MLVLMCDTVRSTWFYFH